MSRMAAVLVGTILLQGVIALTVAAEEGSRDGFGKQWIRSHPLSISASNASPGQWVNSGGLQTYLDANMTAVWAPGYDPSFSVSESASAGAPLHVYLPAHIPLQSVISMYNQVKSMANPTAWMIGDEPSQTHFQQYRAVADYLLQNDPAALRYVNVLSSDADSTLLWGDNTNPSYTHAQYLNDIITTVQPDVLMYDVYPFWNGGITLESQLFSDLMQVRSVALSHGIPYWAWIQGFADDARRLPSESDLRMQLFSHLAAGYTGFSYWSYSIYSDYQTSGLLDGNSQPSSAYYSAADANAEAQNLGRALRYLISTDVRFIPGQTGGTWNIPQGGLTNWTPGAGGDSHLLSTSIIGSNGATQNGLIGFFTDDDGQVAFMLSNLNHGENLSSADTALTFSQVFDSTITELLMIDRQTGMQQMVALDNHTLTVTLPGGTGNLYKYNTGSFVVPEPAALAGVLMVFAATFRCGGRRRSR